MCWLVVWVGCGLLWVVWGRVGLAALENMLFRYVIDMCHSLNASVGALVIGWAGCVMLYKTGSKLNERVALMLAYVISMQLIEALMWSDQKCTGLNQLASKIGFVQNVGQPLVIFLALAPFMAKSLDLPVKTLLAFYGLTLGLFIFSNHKDMLNPAYWCTKAGDGGLLWNWAGSQNRLIWTAFVGSLAASMFASKMSKSTSTATIGTLIASYFRYGNSKAVGSWWCLYAVCLPYIQLLTQ